MKLNPGIMQNKDLVRLALVTGLILLVPLLAMQLTNEVNWGPGDFAAIGVLLFGAGLTYEWAAKKMGNNVHRAAIGVAVVGALLLVWIELAVGILGTPAAGS